MKAKIVEVTRLKLKKDELLVIVVPPMATPQQIDDLQRYLERIFGQGNILVASSDVKFKVIKKQP